MDPRATEQLIIELLASYGKTGDKDDLLEARYLRVELDRWTSRGGF